MDLDKRDIEEIKIYLKILKEVYIKLLLDIGFEVI